MGVEVNLEQLANTIRKDSIQLIYDAGSGHPGGCLSASDILAYLFGKELRGAPADPNRDRFVLSKGHSCPALYSALYRTGRLDYMERLEKKFKLHDLRKLGSPLQGHPSVTHIPEVETSTGSLGQGLSVGVGMALGLKLKGSTARVFVLVGDGDLQEGIAFEAIAFAGHYKLNNLYIIYDSNEFQSDDKVKNIMLMKPATFAFHYEWKIRIVNGHQILYDDAHGQRSIEEAFKTKSNKPKFIVANTTKGKGVDFMEGPDYHGSLTLTKDEYERAMKCLDSS